MATNGIFLDAIGICLLAVAYGSHMTSDEVLSRLTGQTCQHYSICSESHEGSNQTESDALSGAQTDDTCCVYCSCDTDTCIAKGNCCPGIHAEETKPYSPEVTKCHAMQINLDAEQAFNNQDQSVGMSHIGVYMVSNCTNGSMDARCDSPDPGSLHENLPQTAVATGLVYRNIFCAICNDVTETTPWRTYVTCSQKQITKSDVMMFPNTFEKVYSFAATHADADCGVYFQPPSGVQHSTSLCFLNRQSSTTCNPQKGGSSNPENCLNNKPANACCDDTDGTGNCTVRIQTKADYMPASDFVGELNTAGKPATDALPAWTQNDLTPEVLVPHDVSCNDSQVYDPYMKLCRKWYCPDGRQLEGLDCVPVFANLVRTKMSLSLEIYPDPESLAMFDPHNKTDLVHEVIDAMLGEDVGREVVIVGMKKDKTLLYALILVSISEDQDTSLRLYNESTFGQDFYVPGHNGTMTLKVELAAGVKIELGTFFLTDIIIVDLKTYKSYLSVYRLNMTEVETSMRYGAVSKMSFCTQILLDKSEVRDYVDILDIKVSDIRLRTGDFQKEVTRSGDKYRVCVADYLQKAREHLLQEPVVKTYSPQVILSVVCNMLSMVGLLVTLVTYVIFDELRSIPGKNNIMLALHLLFAQCLYQFGMDQTETPTLCIVLGVFIHMFWLTAIFWMNACTLHMFRTFVTGQSYRSVRALDPQVCCYALYCYGAAISMVAINIGVSLYRSRGEDCGYGGHVCYISDPVMVGWVFALPVGVIIILNMGFFFAVVYQISASTMRRRGKATDRTNTIIYMKLSSLTGVTWIFGYLYMWTGFIALEYIFIVLNAGQGVLIFISFICTKRILKLYYNLFRKHTRSCRASACICFRKPPLSDTMNGVDVNTAKISLTGSSSSKGIPMIGRFSQREWRRNRQAAKAVLNRNYSTGHSCKSVNDNSSSDIFRDSMNIAKCMSNPPVVDSHKNGRKAEKEAASFVEKESHSDVGNEVPVSNTENIATICMRQIDMTVGNGI